MSKMGHCLPWAHLPWDTKCVAGHGCEIGQASTVSKNAKRGRGIQKKAEGSRGLQKTGHCCFGQGGWGRPEEVACRLQVSRGDRAGLTS